MFQRIITHLLIISFLIQIPLGLKASLTSIKDENLVVTERFFKSPIPAHSHFKAQKDSTAAGVMVISEHNGKLYTLLGKRDDTQTWCNFGGKTEDGQTYLSQTAAQELMEESCGLYACPAGALDMSPSHTLQLENITYRMYMRDFRYLKSTHFKERMGQATTGSSREYTGFAWVELESLLSGKPVLHPDETDTGDPFELFGDFNAMLHESAVRNVLSNWGKKQSGHTFRRLGAPDNPVPLIKTTWARIDGVQRTALDPSDTAFVVPYGQNAAGEKVVYKTYHKRSKKLIVPVQLNPDVERETFAKAVVKKARTLMELKEKFPQEKEPTPTPEAWKPLVEEFRKASPTERHLKWILKEKFVEGDSLEVYRHNIRTYLELVNDQDRMELRGKLDITEENISKLATLLHQENLALQSPTDPRFSLFHGTVAEVGELYIIFSHLKELLGANPILGSHLARADFSSTHAAPFLLNGVRGTDLYYRQFLEALGKEENRNLTPAQTYCKVFLYGSSKGGDYEKFLVLNRLCTNPALTCGPGLGASTSNSIEYWLKGHSVQTPQIESLFQETCALLGMEGKFTLFNSLFRQYYGISNPKDNNGFIIQLLVTPEFLAHYNHAYHVNFGPDSEKLLAQHPILGDKSLHHHYSSFLSPMEELHRIYPETWTYLLPSKPENSVCFLAYRRDELSPKDLSQFKKELSNVTDHMVAQWLMSNTKLTEGSLYGGDPLLYNLHRMASRLHAGETIMDKASPNGIKYLLDLENFEGVQMILRQHPESVKTLPENEILSLYVKTLSSGDENTAKLFSQVVWGTDAYESHITEKEAFLVMTITLSRLENLKDLKIVSRLDKKFRFKEWSPSSHQLWLSNFHRLPKVSLELASVLGESYGKKFFFAFSLAYRDEETDEILTEIEANPQFSQDSGISTHFLSWCEELNLFNNWGVKSIRSKEENTAALLEACGIDWALVEKDISKQDFAGRGLVMDHFFPYQRPHLKKYLEQKGKIFLSFKEAIEKLDQQEQESRKAIEEELLDLEKKERQAFKRLRAGRLEEEIPSRLVDALKKSVDDSKVFLEKEKERPVNPSKIDPTVKMLWEIVSNAIKTEGISQEKLLESMEPLITNLLETVRTIYRYSFSKDELIRKLQGEEDFPGYLKEKEQEEKDQRRRREIEFCSQDLERREKELEAAKKELVELQEQNRRDQEIIDHVAQLRKERRDRLAHERARKKKEEEEKLEEEKRALLSELKDATDLDTALIPSHEYSCYSRLYREIFPKEQLEQLKTEESKAFDIIKKACETGDVDSLSFLETPRWHYLLSKAIDTTIDVSRNPHNATKVSAEKVVAYLLNLASEKDYPLSLSNSFPMFSLDFLFQLTPRTCKKMWHTYYFSVHNLFSLIYNAPSPMEVKQRILDHFSLEDLHELRYPSNMGESLISVLFKSTESYGPQDRVWIERLKPAFKWKDPTLGDSYGSIFALDSIEKGSFGFFEDLIDLDEFLIPYDKKMTPYEVLSYTVPEAYSKLTVLLRNKGLL